MKRRSFLGSLLATGLPLGQRVLEGGGQQLRISNGTYQNFVRTAAGWKAATLPGNPFIYGPAFTSHDIAAVKKGEDTWWRFRIVLHADAPVKLHQGRYVEPQILVWLNRNSTLMEGQSGSWRRVYFQQPTRNSLGAPGNDLPSVYLLDNNEGIETILYFDMSDMGWMSFQNIPRFLAYRCGMTSRLEPGGLMQRFGVGLIADEATGDTLPAGDIRFTYWLLQRAVPDLLSEQQAVKRWMGALLPLFEEKPGWPAQATTWQEYAQGTVENLQQTRAAQVDVGGHRGLRAYVRGSSQIWQQPDDDFELMAVADVLWPSLLYLRVHKNPAHEELCRQLVDSLPGFYRPDTHSISNNFKRNTDERADSWYPFENALVKWPSIALLQNSDLLRTQFLDALKRSIEMAHECDYLFPVYYRVRDFARQGAGTNYAIGGLLAYGLLLAHRMTRETRYRDEAIRAVDALYTVPAEKLFHEPQELAFGALAAAELGNTEAAEYLLLQQLRMFYWYTDPSQPSQDIRGMVQAAASILYPAFKENVESILPWTGLMKCGIVNPTLLRMMNQQRRNNFSFFQRTTESPFIPLENLGTLELSGQTGNVGKEIYGAGECLWMYLMFEALGSATDRDLLLVNLDVLDDFDSERQTFILFNPGEKSSTAELRFRRNGQLMRDGKPASTSIPIGPGEWIRLELITSAPAS